MRALRFIPLSMAAAALHGEAVVSPVSGVNREAGHRDGKGAGAAFNDPMGLARDAQGNVFLCDARNHVIRKITAAGVVSTVAGAPGVGGWADGAGGAARFRFPADIAVSPEGDLYVADSGNHCIRMIKADGTVSTIAGSPGSTADVPAGTASGYAVVPRNPDGSGGAARFNSPGGIAYAGGDLYVSDTGNHLIRRVDMQGNVTTVAGKAGEWGWADGAGASARFSAPLGMCMGSDGNLYIADSDNHAIRRMTPQATVTTFSGDPAEHGCKAGAKTEVRYSVPVDVSPHPEGGFIVCESFCNTLFRVGADGSAAIFSGGSSGTARHADLSNPSSAVCDALGNVYVADTFSQEIRLVIEKFGMAISGVGADKRLTITWDSLPGRDYQLQLLGESGWGNAPHPPVRAVGQVSSTSFPLPSDPNGIYRILLLGF
ncbi:hypothetical protein HZ994_18765 [Akkermansiaceae bacterium]|nr:hypothetical protein HZ994_18765 [Akkermansiaceae bacterium]